MFFKFHFSEKMKVLLVLILMTTAKSFASFDLGICETCTCQRKIKDNNSLLQVNCTSSPRSERLIDMSSTSSITEVHLTMERMNLTSVQRYKRFESLNVTSLSLNYNKIKSIPSHIFSKFNNLMSLSLVGNEIDDISQESFGGLANLKSLNISYNALQTFDMLYLHDLRKLQTLDLRGNSLLKFDSTSTLQYMKLQHLDLSENKLSAFPTTPLKMFSELILLNLTKNQIKLIPKDALEMQNILETLHFAENQLADIDPHAFPDGNRLKTLNLNHNLILSTQFIEKLKSLTFLDLSYNTVTSVKTTLWSRNLTELLIGNNGLTSLDDILKGLPQLKKLDASWNQCNKIPDNLNTNLKELILDDNAVTSLPLRPPGNGTLTYLSLSDLHRLKTLKKDTFNGVFSTNMNNTPCATLEICRTGLQSIEKGALKNLNICHLKLCWNDLTELPEDTFDWEKIQTIDLQGNPWHCSCSMQWLLDKVVAKMYNSHQDLLENLRCQTPKSLEGTRLVHWFNKTEPMLCNKDNLKENNLIRITSSPAMIALDICFGVIAVALVATGFYLQRKIIKQRRNRKNRRF